MTDSPTTPQQWQRLAAYQGGTVAGLAVAHERTGAQTIFAGTPTGVFRSADAGQSWHPTGPAGVLPFVTSVAASSDYATDRTLFAGTWTGLFRSRSAGESWHPILAGGGVLAVVVSSATPDQQMVFVGTADDGILRSDDGGEHWVGANAGLLDLSVQALVLSPRFPDDGTAFAGTTSGLYRSRNGGQSWQEVDIGLDAVSIQAVALGPGFPDDPLVAVGCEANGFLLSEDGGEDWIGVHHFDDRSVTSIEMQESAAGAIVIAVGADNAVLFSEDRGQSWREYDGLDGPVLALASVDAVGNDDARTETLAGLAGGGVIRLSAAAQCPERTNEGLHATPLSMFAVSSSFTRDGTLLAASTDGTVVISRDQGRTLDRLALDLDELAVTGLVMSPGYQDDGTVWISTPGTLFRSRDAALTWEALPINAAAGILDAAQPGTDPDDVPARVLAAVQEAGQVALFLAVGARVGRSDDQGDSWRWLGPLDGHGTVVSLVGQRQPEVSLVLFALTAASDGRNVAQGQKLWRSIDGGQEWECWLDGAADVAPVMLGWDSLASDAGLLVALGGTVSAPRADAQERRGRQVRPLWRSALLGPTVSQISSLATPSGPLAGRIVFAGTNAGIFVSRDGGHTFAPWSEGLGDGAAPAAVLALAVSPAYAASGGVFALTAGGVVWRRSDW
jgi:photosystem II stability/assembly factor-like uncharacterized protein